MGETIAVLFFLFVLVVVGMVFYFRVQMVNVQVRSAESRERASIRAVQNILYLPEIQCLNSGASTTDITSLCFDENKLRAFSDVVSNNPAYYKDIFQNSYIRYKIIYLDSGNEVVVLGKTQTNMQKISTTVPVNIYDPIEEKYYYALLTVDYYTD